MDGTPMEESPMDGITAAQQYSDEADAAARATLEHQRHEELLRARDRFDHHPPSTPEVIQAHETARQLGADFATWLLRFVPPGHDRDRALDAIDDAVMRINAAIARSQLHGAWFRQEPRGQ